MTAEHQRLTPQTPWKQWGPYLSERQWGTVREDYSEFGTAWDYFSHDQARARAYRWGEDGLAGISDDQQLFCFALALWNGQDPILKERLFGLTGSQGNHGEDVKEYYFYLDSTPTHSYMKMLYKYPQAPYPYAWLVEENQRRSRQEPEFELLDTGVFNDQRYFDVFVEYIKAESQDILIQITVCNRGDEPAPIHVLPTLWFRNTWSWGYESVKPYLKAENNRIFAHHETLGNYVLTCDENPTLLFTENETNYQQVYGTNNPSPYVKDSFHRYVIHDQMEAVNPQQTGTKASVHYVYDIPAQGTQVIRLRLTHENVPGFPNLDFDDFDTIVQQRKQEADAFYATITPGELSPDYQLIQRQAFAGMLWSKQYYRYDMETWLKGDPAMPAPPPGRKKGRNHQWFHLDTQEILSMPDKWEYPWFAAWDLAFHTITLALIDPDFAKHQLDLLTREWYMHPNGQMPAYEWNFGDVNPPVHGWAAWRVYQMEKKQTGTGDRLFLERVFHKLLMYFTWWVNRKDSSGRNVFEGGFLGLDNIGVFDRSSALPTGGYLQQSDGTSWMGMYCLNMLTIALELALENPAYEDIATKFFEHFLYIATAMNNLGGEGISLWDEGDGFFYDVLNLPTGENVRLKVRSMVGLIPLYAVETLEPEILDRLPGFKQRLNWFMQNRPDLTCNLACMQTLGMGERRLFSIVDRDRLRQILQKMLDESEFFGDFGIRAISRYHRANPYTYQVDGQEYRVDYEPAESSTGLFGGNSNWRGPVWMPVNYLLVESLQKFHRYLGDDFQVECPTGSGQWLTLQGVAQELSRRLVNIFARSESRRPVYGATALFQNDPHWRDLILFYEYFHGDNGAGIGASHQTGWTGIVAELLQQLGA
ncbi:Glucosidase I [Gloeomargarita lithophora Alchichica-D10]|uniref:Glucosidase I n=1 Tax=Gloeomargarita lithophora Alchichica-D10 TaxID=1188229 RepID=A0A1J0AA01_9CYAN|nr:glucosidase [Gloeomargarita lithophora]APB32758.1 Glucosidase I [Gloeomargarita lithophora Alchichica-D10]